MTGQMLEKRPGHMVAIRARALMEGSLGDSEADSLHVAKALALMEAQARDWEAIVKIDPSNQIALSNMIGSKDNAGFALFRMGRLRESLENHLAALALQRQAQEAGPALRNLFFASGRLTSLEADMGNRPASEAARKASLGFAAMATRDLPPESFSRFLFAEWSQLFFGYSLPVAAADYETVRGLAVASIQRIENFTPKDAS